MSEHFIHPSSDVQTDCIGKETRIWQFCVVLEGATIGRNCNVCSHCLIEGKVLVGDRVTIKSGVQLWDGVELEDDVFIGPNATFSNDRYPRSKEAFNVKKTIVRHHASIGANATILPGIEIGAHAMVGAGAVVTKDVPPGKLVLGVPARVVSDVRY